MQESTYRKLEEKRPSKFAIYFAFKNFFFKIKRFIALNTFLSTYPSLFSQNHSKQHPESTFIFKCFYCFNVSYFITVEPQHKKGDV